MGTPQSKTSNTLCRFMSISFHIYIYISSLELQKKSTQNLSCPNLENEKKQLKNSSRFPMFSTLPPFRLVGQKSPQGAPKVMDHIKVVPEARRMERWCKFVGDPKWREGTWKNLISSQAFGTAITSQIFVLWWRAPLFFFWRGGIRWGVFIG